MDSIFEPFFTTKKQGEGTGLGLAAVYGTIRDHHGLVNVYSELGDGTVFHIYLPCSSEKRVSIKFEEDIKSGSGNILLVDDEELIRITGKTILEDMGYTVTIAENGIKAVEVYEKIHKKIDLIIMDMIMPEMNGSEAFMEMKNINKMCKVIIASGYSKNESLDELKKKGLAGFIQKPYQANELSNLIHKVLDF